MLSNLFHTSLANWFSSAFGSPTEVQFRAWEQIKLKKDTLIAAPTGSGKTLAAFLAAINDLLEQGLSGTLQPGVQVVYISPLKALSNDIERNLQFPLKGLREELKKEGLPEVSIEVMVRTGDTPVAERTQMIKNPPHILVTTPESLYLLLTSKNGRRILSTTHTLIIDEIHALVGSKRGSHLSLSVERLEHLTGSKLHRIGVSATQKPIEQVALFLAGSSPPLTPPEGENGLLPFQERKNEVPPLLRRELGRGEVAIINTGHRRRMELSLELPNSPLTAVMANEVWGEIYDRLVNLIESHKTTLIFVNTRRLAERMAHNLREKFAGPGLAEGGEGVVMAHHGSMSKDHRFDAEQKLKSGSLKALVATASLELGIDIGSVDLVCQIGSPRSISAFLQRVGRSGHSVMGTPRGKLFPLTRDELVESVALLDAIKKGELDHIIMPEKPLDILSQQIVAEVASEDYDEEELYTLFTKAYPYRNLVREEFDEIVKMLSEGYTTRRGRRGAYLHHDMVNNKLRARKGARLAAIVSGGAIPDNFDYDIILEPENVFVGTLNEDFAVESIPGDIFQLGNNTWKILKVETGKVRVEDAAGQPPSIPFWLGEAPGRTDELSFSVSRLRNIISEKLGDLNELPPEVLAEEDSGAFWKQNAVQWLVNEVEIDPAAADQLVTYLATAKAALGIIPLQENLLLERFFDEAGDMHLVIHSPYGSRINKAWGLALRKRFCKKFNFELQAAATEDAIILSLGATHSFPLEEVYGYLSPDTVRHILIQALLDAPVFGVRWRWNATRALAVPRRRGGEKVPPQIQRSMAEDLIALTFPDQLACFENIQGEREVPDHPLVKQTIHDCLTEAMDIEGLERLLLKIKNREIALHAMDLREASPLAQEILTARPYAFLDDAPLEERRTNAIQTRRWINPAEAKELGRLDMNAILAVKEEAWPQASNADELHDALVLCGFITREEGIKNNWEEYFRQLIAENRAAVLINNSPANQLWVAAERLPQLMKIYPDASVEPLMQLPQRILEQDKEKDPMTEIIRGQLEALGPVTSDELASRMALPESQIMQALLALEVEGFVFRGNFTPDRNQLEWCERRLLSRIHRYTLKKLRSEIEPVSPADLMRFLFAWHRVDITQEIQGPESLRKVLAQLEGYEAQAAAWESDILPLRVQDYEHTWLNTFCLSGLISWGRFRLPKQEKPSSGPIRTTPIALVNRQNLEAWKNSGNGIDYEKLLSSDAYSVFKFLEEKGASFFHDIQQARGLFKSKLEDALSELVAASLVTSDSFTGLRALLVPAKYKSAGGLARAKNLPFTMENAGRWSLLKYNENATEKKSAGHEYIARALLRRYGVIFRRVTEREPYSPPWRDLVRILRLMEARGEIRGGRFITGVWGEQFALPEAVVLLRSIRKEEKKGKLISISASDPLNLTGIITPGRRISSIYTNRILYLDGVPVAVKEGQDISILIDVDEKEQWQLKNALIRKRVSPRLRAYLGKGVY